MVEQVAQNIPIPENETVATIQLDSFAVAVMDVTKIEEFPGQDFAIDLGALLGSDDLSLDQGEISINMRMMTKEPTASLSIAETFFQSSSVSQALNEERGNATSNMTVNVVPRIINSVYLTPALFPRINRDEGSNISSTTTAPVGSIILSSTLAVTTITETKSSQREVRVRDINPPIILTFMKNPVLANGTNANTSCTFWDFAENGELSVHLPCTLSKSLCVCMQMDLVTGQP